MSETNLYAPPKSEQLSATPSGQFIWREGKKIVVLKQGHAFPDRCFKCNQPAVAPRRTRKLSWHNPWLYLLILFNILIYAIVASIVRKRASVDIGLCVKHQKRFVWSRIIGWVGFLPVFGLLFFSFSQPPAAIIAGCLLVLAWLISLIVLGNTILAQRIDTDFIRIKGCGPEFLASLDDFSLRWQGSVAQGQHNGPIQAAPSQQFRQLKR